MKKKSQRSRAGHARLEERLRAAEDTLDAIRHGHVDALVVQGPRGEQVFTLEGADHRYRRLVETMNEGAVLLAPSGTILYGNARLAALLAAPLERIVGVELFEFVPAEWRGLVDALLHGGAPCRAEAELCDARGERVPVYLSATTSYDDGERLVYMVVTDLAEQKRTQEMLATERITTMIVDQAAEGIVVCDPDGRVIRASRAAIRLSIENPLLRPFEEVFPLRGPDGADVARALLAAALRGETTSGVEVSLVRPDQARIDLLLSAGPVLHGDRAPLGCVLSFVDVTDRLRDAEERQRLLERARTALSAAEAANRTKDEFLAMLGHELRNPLAPILTALELLRLRGDASTRKEHAVIERQVRHVVRLVDDLLDVSRITRGKIELDRKPHDLEGIVAQAIEMAAPLIEERSHHLHVDVAAGLRVHGDATRLAQVIANLLTNAAKYTDPGGQVTVRAGRDGGEVVVAVSDDGAGIPAEILPDLFELFVQGRRTLDRSEGGLGLGLAIVRSMVAMHGGTVSARSDGIGCGSTFEVRLPSLPAAPAPAPDAPPVTPPPPPEAGDHGKRVLIVDDNVDAADMLAETLEALGHHTRVAYDGPSALMTAATFEPEVALLDIGLPVMDGYELARQIRGVVAGEPALRLIALTGYGQDADRRRTAEAGFDNHLVKPIDVRALMSAIDRR